MNNVSPIPPASQLVQGIGLSGTKANTTQKQPDQHFAHHTLFPATCLCTYADALITYTHTKVTVNCDIHGLMPGTGQLSAAATFSLKHFKGNFKATHGQASAGYKFHDPQKKKSTVVVCSCCYC